MLQGALRSKWLWLSVALLVLLAVFVLYLQPDFMLTVADQVWACF